MTSPQDHTSRLIEHLSSTSTPYMDPLSRVPWDHMERQAFWLPQEAVSLYGWAEYTSFPLEQRRMLSRYEFLHMLETVMVFESVFMERIGRMLQDRGGALDRAHYQLHMVRENAGHGLMLLELNRRARLPASTSRPNDLLLRGLGRYASLDSLPFWLLTFISDEVFNRWFRFVRKHQSEVCPVIGEIARIHLVDAARHLSHAHELLEAQLSKRPVWHLRLWQPLMRRILSGVVRSLFYPPPTVYESAGLYPGEYWVKVAHNNPHRLKFVQQNIHSTLRPLKKRGLRIDWI